ncbi:MAG: hypothetical protein WBP13_05410 [Methylophilaceae bacterium]
MEKLDIGFKAFSTAPNLKAGLVFRLVSKEEDSEKYLYFRITHVFKDTGRLYYIEISTPEQVRFAKRPRPILISTLNELFEVDKKNSLGSVPLPQEFIRTKNNDDSKISDQEIADYNYALLEPLLEKLEDETCLQSRNFEPEIKKHALAINMSQVSLRKMLLRYWYFGQSTSVLGPRTRGPKSKLDNSTEIAISVYDNKISSRRGPKARITQVLGDNEFVVSLDDIKDMRKCLEKKLRKSYTDKVRAHRDYLAYYFSKRHPEVYQKYLEKKIPEPVTVRQYRSYTNGTEWLDPEVLEKLIKTKTYQTTTGALLANGPNEIYELDATVNRIFLVSKKTHAVIGQPTLYVVIDRWSRFIVGVYISLKSPSWEELSYAILVSFTSRNKRFKYLGVDINDERWPVGKPPAVFMFDRGSEFRGHSAEKSIADNLKIEIGLLPRRTPDGKAVVERVIRELKSRNGSASIEGAYQRRPTDYETRKVVKAAKGAAAYNLQEIFLLLIKEVESYNSSPHDTLKKNVLLVREGVAPTPKEAYLWGQKHISGLNRPPYSDEDYQKMLLGTDKASIAGGTLNYKRLTYRPDNATAKAMLLRSGKRAKPVKIRIDKSHPEQVYVETSHQEWACWKLTSGALNSFRGMTLDEIDQLREQGAMLYDVAKNDPQVIDLQNTIKRTKSQKNTGEITLAESRQARKDETLEIKKALLGHKQILPKETIIQSKPNIEPWEELAQAERNRKLHILSKSRK